MCVCEETGGEGTSLAWVVDSDEKNGSMIGGGLCTVTHQASYAFGGVLVKTTLAE